MCRLNFGARSLLERFRVDGAFSAFLSAMEWFIYTGNKSMAGFRELCFSPMWKSKNFI